MIPKSSSPAPGKVLRKLALYGGIMMFSLYLVAVAGGYSWLRFVRKNEQLRLVDVALIRMGAIRRSIAAQHFANAEKEWKAKNFQAAYLYFSAAVRQDPENVPGRLAAVQFLRSVGAGSLGLVMLEEGLALAPNDIRMIEPTFELLLSTSRDRHALDLLQKRYGTERSGRNGVVLQRYEVAATLAAEGAPAAKKLLERYSGLLQDSSAAPVVARVLWESQERTQAIDLLQEHVRTPSAVYDDFAQLARWQEAGGQVAAAAQTVRRACEKFPRELPPRALLIEMLMAETPGGAPGSQAIAAYLQDFADRPESLMELAELAGRKGWVDLSRTLYQIGANRKLDLDVLALAYSDALTRGSRFKEVSQILTQIETQATEGKVPFMVQLRQRQVITSAALGESDNVREYARRLAALLNRDQDGLEVCRRLFRKLGIPDAVAELSSRSLIAPTATVAAAHK